MSQLTQLQIDRRKVELLRDCHARIGHTDGKPFESATVSMTTGRKFDLYSMTEILELLAHFEICAALGTMSVIDRFVYRMLMDNGILSAFNYMAEWEAENDLN